MNLEQVIRDPRVSPGAHIVVWFSCGAASAVAAKLTIALYGGDCHIRVVNNPIKEEHSDNRRFLADVEQWLGVPIEIQTNSKQAHASAEEVWRRQRYMSGVKGAPCTRALKKEARQEWERSNKFDWLVMGFTAEEIGRLERFRFTERDNTLSPLVDNQVTKSDCFRILEAEGLELPEFYRLGAPNGNCIGCVKSSSPRYWSFIRHHFPSVFEARCVLSRAIGCKLLRLKGRRVFLDELPQDIPPIPHKGYSPPECGIFCEETKK